MVCSMDSPEPIGRDCSNSAKLQPCIIAGRVILINQQLELLLQMFVRCRRALNHWQQWL